MLEITFEGVLFICKILTNSQSIYCKIGKNVVS